MIVHRLFREEKHPRHPKGSQRGGKFAPKWGPRQAAPPYPTADDEPATIDLITGEWVRPPANQESLRQHFRTTHRGRWREDLPNDAARQKDAIADMLRNATGIELDAVSGLVKEWAKAANGEDMGSLGIQEVASEIFGAPLSPYQAKRIDAAKGKWTTNVYPFEALFGRERAREKIADVLRAIRADTAAYFAEQGVTHLRLYRGYVDQDGRQLGGVSAGESVQINDNALASWSLDLNQDYKFMDFDEDEHPDGVAVVLSAIVPVERILSTARTGLGCLDEEEVVVLGSTEPSFAEVVRVHIAEPYDDDDGDDYDGDDYDDTEEEDDEEEVLEPDLQGPIERYWAASDKVYVAHLDTLIAAYNAVEDPARKHRLAEGDQRFHGRLPNGDWIDSDNPQQGRAWDEDYRAWVDSLLPGVIDQVEEPPELALKPYRERFLQHYDAISAAWETIPQEQRAEWLRWNEALFGDIDDERPYLHPGLRSWLDQVVPGIFDGLRPLPALAATVPEQAAKAWNVRYEEAKHPRHPKGRREGGRFAPKPVAARQAAPDFSHAEVFALPAEEALQRLAPNLDHFLEYVLYKRRLMRGHDLDLALNTPTFGEMVNATATARGWDFPTIVQKLTEAGVTYRDLRPEFLGKIVSAHPQNLTLETFFQLADSSEIVTPRHKALYKQALAAHVQTKEIISGDHLLLDVLPYHLKLSGALAAFIEERYAHSLDGYLEMVASAYRGKAQRSGKPDSGPFPYQGAADPILANLIDKQGIPDYDAFSAQIRTLGLDGYGWHRSLDFVAKHADRIARISPQLLVELGMATHWDSVHVMAHMNPALARHLQQVNLDHVTGYLNRPGTQGVSLTGWGIMQVAVDNTPVANPQEVAARLLDADGELTRLGNALSGAALSQLLLKGNAGWGEVLYYTRLKAAASSAANGGAYTTTGELPVDALLRTADRVPARDFFRQMAAVGPWPQDMTWFVGSKGAPLLDYQDLTPVEAKQTATMLIVGEEDIPDGLKARLDAYEATAVDAVAGATVALDRTELARVKDFFEHVGGDLNALDDLADAGAQKAAICRALASQVGLTADQVSGLLRNWADSSNNGHPILRVQEAATRVLGTVLSDWQHTLLAKYAAKDDPNYWMSNDMHPATLWRMGIVEAEATLDRLLLAMRRRTAQWFDEAGIDHVRLYRGVRLPRRKLAGVKVTQTLAYDDNALASWSLDYETARHFAQMDRSADTVGLVVSAWLPKDRIVSNARTGFGCLGENEFVVLGSKEPSYARVEYLDGELAIPAATVPLILADDDLDQPEPPWGKAWVRFDPTKHPRHPKGQREGGRFAPKWGEFGEPSPNSEARQMPPRTIYVSAEGEAARRRILDAYAARRPELEEIDAQLRQIDALYRHMIGNDDRLVRQQVESSASVRKLRVRREDILAQLRAELDDVLAVPDPAHFRFVRSTLASVPAAVHALLDRAEAQLNRLVSRKLAERMPNAEIFVGRREGQRSYYDNTLQSIWVGTAADVAAVVHETGHWIEHRLPAVNAATLAFLNRRTRGQRAHSLQELTGLPYREHERARPDRFVHPYVGASYRREGSYKCTEVLSMGLEYFAKEPWVLAEGDPEMFDLVYDLARGRLPASSASGPAVRSQQLTAAAAAAAPRQSPPPAGGWQPGSYPVTAYRNGARDPEAVKRVEQPRLSLNTTEIEQPLWNWYTQGYTITGRDMRYFDHHEVERSKHAAVSAVLRASIDSPQEVRRDPRTLEVFGPENFFPNFYHQIGRTVQEWAGETTEYRRMVTDWLTRRRGIHPQPELDAISYDEANRLVARWASNSNGQNMAMVALHHAAAEEFGLELSDWQEDTFAQTLEASRPAYEQLVATNDPQAALYHDMYRYAFELRDGQGRFSEATRAAAHTKLRRVVRDLYERTQADLASLPGDTVRLYRGVLVDITGRKPLKKGEVADLVSNSLESWTAMQAVAEDFRFYAQDRAPKLPGRVFQAVTIMMDVPKQRIFATPRTGLGCLDEWEFVVLGGTPTVDESLITAAGKPVRPVKGKP